MKQINATYSQSEKAWYVHNTNTYRWMLDLPPAGIGKEALARIGTPNQSAFKRLEEQLILKAYSPSTIRTYCTEFAQLLYLLKQVQVGSLDAVGNYEEKQTLQKILFPRGISYNRENDRCRTSGVNNIFLLLGRLSGS
jgi:hypothetical protein